MIVYARDSSKAMPRKKAKRTQPKWRDGFSSRKDGQGSFKYSPSVAPKSALDDYLGQAAPLDCVLDVLAPANERSSVISTRRHDSFLYKQELKHSR